MSACHESGQGVVAMKVIGHGAQANQPGDQALLAHFLERGLTPGGCDDLCDEGDTLCVSQVLRQLMYFNNGHEEAEAMNATHRLQIMVGSCLAVFAVAVPSIADDPCEDASANVALIVRLLNGQVLDPATAKGAALKVTPAADLDDGQPESFTVTYGSSAKALATVFVRRMTADWVTQWSGYPILKMRAKGDALDVMWDSGGSRCCSCSYLVALQGRGFRATPVVLPRGRFDP